MIVGRSFLQLLRHRFPGYHCHSLIALWSRHTSVNPIIAVSIVILIVVAERSTFDAMSQAVEKSAIVVPALTAKYQQSINCRKGTYIRL